MRLQSGFQIERGISGESDRRRPALTRRTFLGAAAALAPAWAAASQAIRLGGPIFLKSDDPAEMAREHRRLGYSAAYCPQVTIDDWERIRTIHDAFAKE